MATVRTAAFVLAALSTIPFAVQAQTTTVAGFTPGSFRVTESGAAEYRIPIRVPPGIGGMEPALALVYNSQAGNGLVGMGWNLEGLSAITRCPMTMAQDGVRGAVNYDMNDRYCLDGQRLVAVNGAYGVAGTEYRTEREWFSRVASYGTAGNGPAWFKVWTKSGQIMEYGNTDDSRIEAQGKPTVRVWVVNKVVDTKGNYFTVTYTEASLYGDFYPDHIDYSGNAAGGITPTAAVRFSYEARTDLNPILVAGSLVKSLKRLSRIEAAVGGMQVKDYRLTYDNSGATGRSKVSVITECSGNECLAATTLSWQVNASADFQYWTNSSGARGSATNYAHYFADVNGDGKTDWIQVARGWSQGWVGLANGDGSFNHWTSASDARGAVNDFEHYFADVNGDGKADWIQVARGWDQGWIGLSNGDGTFNHWTSTTLAAGGVNNYAHYFADVDGDGRADWIQVARGWNQGWVGLANGDGTFNQWTSASDARGALNDFEHYFADVNGNGKADWIQVARGWDQGWIGLSNGDGTFNHWTATTTAAGAVNNYAHYFADVNGDGRADWIQIARGWDQGWVALSRGDGTFEYWTSASGARGALNNYEHYFVDVNGDGMADWIQVSRASDIGWVGLSKGDGTFEHWTNFSYARGSVNNHEHHFADVNGDGLLDWIQVARYGDIGWVGLGAGSSPDLLVSISNGAGVTISAVYKPLTDATVYAKDTSSTYPWVDLQQPMQVVSSYSSSDGIGGTQSTTFTYGGAKLDHGGRGLLGFRWQEATQSSTGVKVRTEFSQNWPYVGMPSLVKTTQSSGTILSQASNTLDCKDPVSGASCLPLAPGKRYFPFVSQSVQTGNDLNAAALPTVTTTTQYGDGFGNATSVVVSTGDGYSKSTTNVYNNDTTNWLLGRLKSSTVQSVVPAP